MRALLLAGCLLVFLGEPALAHKPSDSYLTLDWHGKHVDGRWDIALRDLDYAVGLDGNGDGAITWSELRGRQALVAAHALNHLKLARNAKPCLTQSGALEVDRHSDGAYAVLRFTAQCRQAAGPFTVGYSLLFDVDPTHHGLLNLRADGREVAAVLTPAAPEFQTTAAEISRWRGFGHYIREGVGHIWSGYDHLAFLLLLLLPVVLRRRNGRWESMPDLRSTGVAVLKVVTAFTVAHSITLSLAVLRILVLPARPVEIAIAASVAVAAVYNLIPRRSDVDHGWRIAFAFGLLHGFGFANVLNDLGLAGASLLATLAGFNLGVELGQLAIVVLLLPVMYALRGSWLYRRALLPGGSLALALVAGVWIWQRAVV